MFSKIYFSLTIGLALMIATECYSQNWQPFPFKIAYYGKRFNFNPSNEAQRPYTAGWLIDALYLDDSTISGDVMTRKRSLKFETLPLSSYPETFGSGKPFFGNCSLSVQFSNGTISMVSELPAISTQFFPDRVKKGLNPMAGFGPVDTIVVESVLGVLDSVAYLNGGVKWGKSFGIIQLPDSNEAGIQLKGIGDLGLGWQDNVGKLKDPKPGDEFHFWKSEIGGYVCTTQFGNYSGGANENKWLRMKVLSVNANTTPTYEVIESAPGAPTGILYHQNISQHGGGTFQNNVHLAFDSIPSIGIWKNFNDATTSVGFMSDSGQHFVVLKHFIIDDYLKTYFVSCAKAPLSFFYHYLPIIWSAGFCEGSVDVFNYPVYTKIANGCTFGTPFPNVTITENKGLISEIENPLIYPNPVQETFQFNPQTKGNFEIFDPMGKSIKKGKIAEEPIRMTGLSSGIYFYKVENEGNNVLKGRFLKL